MVLRAVRPHGKGPREEGEAEQFGAAHELTRADGTQPCLNQQVEQLLRRWLDRVVFGRGEGQLAVPPPHRVQQRLRQPRRRQVRARVLGQPERLRHTCVEHASQRRVGEAARDPEAPKHLPLDRRRARFGPHPSPIASHTAALLQRPAEDAARHRHVAQRVLLPIRTVHATDAADLNAPDRGRRGRRLQRVGGCVPCHHDTVACAADLLDVGIPVVLARAHLADGLRNERVRLPQTPDRVLSVELYIFELLRRRSHVSPKLWRLELDNGLAVVEEHHFRRADRIVPELAEATAHRRGEALPTRVAPRLGDANHGEEFDEALLLVRHVPRE
mmetsp:Transcript_66271/g.182985  ORF Transcript_66271/g.182985 Transcript_66271/m.182985 type:complete len:330 (-) Transcript_66271:1007-1996(-)